MTKPDGIDQSWGFADPKQAVAAGIKVVSMYLSRDPSKNVTAAKVKAYHAVGIGVLLNWEGQAGAPLNGAEQGRADAGDAVVLVKALIAAVDYKPSSRLSIIFSCDRDTTPANYPKIDAYYEATKSAVHAAGYLNGVYGEFDLVNHLHAAGLTDVEWQAYAWSSGRLSPEADFYQFHNGQTLGGASVDFDRIIHPAQLGAWWPPNNPLNTGEDMPLNADDLAAIQKIVDHPGWVSGRDGKPHSPDTVIRMAVGDHVDKPLADLSALDAAVQAAVAKLQLSGVDPNVLAKEIASHLTLAVK